ncbi:MAG TPA: glycosyltransferase family 2 protein [Leeuwenhoekiella sp.]|nr:glycosyltransferase family 2 protein [Leeuwenhoekiella sp.]
MENKISIIIPCFNSSNYLKETLNSIISQTYEIWECILIDDGSTDDTWPIIKYYEKNDHRIKGYQRPSTIPKGPSACRNFGLKKCDGNWIKFFDSDDILISYALEVITQKFKKDIDVVISSLKYVDEKLKPLDKKHKYISDNLIEDYITNKISYYTFTPTWNRFFLENQMEMFDENIINIEDWDFNLRMLYKKPIIVFIDEELILYRKHSLSLSKEIEKLNVKEFYSEIYARNKHLKLLAINKQAEIAKLRNYIIYRTKFFIRIFISEKQRIPYSAFAALVKQSFLTSNGKCVVKSFMGLFSFLLFKKGYIFFK